MEVCTEVRFSSAYHLRLSRFLLSPVIEHDVGVRSSRLGGGRNVLDEQWASDHVELQRHGRRSGTSLPNVFLAASLHHYSVVEIYR